MLKTLALRRMPSENDVAREMVFYLANHNVTGETLHPSCGLMLEKLTMSGDFIGQVHSEWLAQLADSTVMIFGDAMHEEMADLAHGFSARVRESGANLKNIVVVVASERGRTLVEAYLKKQPEEQQLAAVQGAAAKHAAIQIVVEPLLGSADVALSKMAAQFGAPDVVVSFPLGEIAAKIPQNSRQKHGLPSSDDFKQLVEEQITNHLILARRASLVDGGTRIIFVTPRVLGNANAQTHAMAGFVRTALRPLTVTAGQEGTRLIHKPVFNQIDVVGSAEQSSERLIEAALLMSLPFQGQQSKDAAKAARLPRATVGTTITI